MSKSDFLGFRRTFWMFREHLFRSILNFFANFFQNLKYQKCPIKRSLCFREKSMKSHLNLCNGSVRRS